MKNFVYLGTALHMIFLANLSPSNAMHKNEGEKDVPLVQVPVKMQKYQDNENKIIEMPSPWSNTNVSFPQQDIIKMDIIFEWKPEAIALAKTTFENTYNEADSVLLQVTESSETSNAQKGLAKDWPMEVFARGNGPMSKHVQGLIAENNTLKNEVSQLTSGDRVSSSPIAASTIDAQLKESLFDIIENIVSDDRDIASNAISLLDKFGVAEEQINKWKTQLEKTMK